jgi:sarcosine oxidase subunit beta
VLNILHHVGEVRSANRRVEANHLQGIDAELLDAQQVKEFCPIINISPDVRYPVMGGALQRRGGTARHDRVAWALATRASERGVDIVEHAEVTGFLRGNGGSVTGVETTRGPIRANKVALVAAGHTSVLAEMVGLRLPVQSHPLQALVSALYQPVLNWCRDVQRRVYVSQADKGEFVMGAPSTATTATGNGVRSM